MNERLLIVAETRLYREGLSSSLEALGFAIAGTAASAAQAVAALDACPVDVVLLDMASLEATEAARALSARAPDVTIVALAVPEREGHVLACAEAGVASYVPREATLNDLATAIDAAARGEVTCSPKIAASLLRHVRTLSLQRAAAPASLPLTARQWEILALVDEGLSNKLIAQRLQIELPTVKNHIHNILGKLQVSRRSEAAAVARRHRARGRV